MDAAGAIAYLHSLYRGGEPRLGLGRVAALLARLGDPHQAMRTVHITGTNGKGSVAAQAASILGRAGLRTGLFTSPYLERFGERIRLDGREISGRRLASLVARLRAAIEELTAAGGAAPTEFEAVVALACLYYQAEAADVVVWEVGIGGRHDATNMVPGSLVSVITSIGLDHVERIGPTIEDIAREKAGIIRPGGVVVTGRLPAGPAAVVEAEAAAQDATVLALGRDFDCEPTRLDDNGLEVVVHGLAGNYPPLRSGLLGAHQADNLAVAVAAVEAANRGGLGLDATCLDRAVVAGAAATRWPGRIEVLCHDPLVVLDGAHNPAAVKALADTVQAVYPGRRAICVIGSLDGHAHEALLTDLAPLATEIIVTTPPFAPRAVPAERFARLIKAAYPDLRLAAVPAPAAAIDAALERLGTGRDDAMLLVTGSLYLAGEARPHLRARLAGLSSDRPEV